MKNFFNYPLHILFTTFESLGKFYILISSALKSINQWRDNLDNIVNQMIAIGIKSIPIVIWTSLFSGMVAGVQAADQFQIETDAFPVTDEAVKFLGTVIGNSVVLELGPMITALVMTGKIGATIAAEIGSMRVTEQIDALESISFNPIAYLIMPRILASFLMFPYLVFIADIFGVTGGMLSSTTSYDRLSSSMFFEGFNSDHLLRNTFFGMIKGMFFGFAITSIACYNGFYAKGGALGVGRAATVTVVVSCISIVILDYLLAAILLGMWM